MNLFSVRDGWEIYDTDADAGGRKFRSVTYRTAEGIGEGVEYLRVRGRKETEILFACLASKRYCCVPKALSDFNNAL